MKECFPIFIGKLNFSQKNIKSIIFIFRFWWRFWSCPTGYNRGWFVRFRRSPTGQYCIWCRPAKTGRFVQFWCTTTRYFNRVRFWSTTSSPCRQPLWCCPTKTGRFWVWRPYIYSHVFWYSIFWH